ncbi:MAG: enoyl-CoA hydratase/isomerase family protein [Ramlibacter sp.]
MSENHVSYEVRDGIAFVTLRRPEKLNALTSGMTAALAEAWACMEADDAVKVAILRAEGPSFCAGADLLAEHAPDAQTDGLSWRLRMSRAIPKNGVRVFKPIIGCIQGYTLGIGYILAIKGCDITIAGSSALLGYPESVAGVVSQPLEYQPYMPFKTSLEFALMAWKNGRLIDSERAYQLGLVNAVVPDGELETEALRWADMLKQIPPLYVRAIKYGHYKSIDTARAQQDRDYLDFVWPQENSPVAPDMKSHLVNKRQ